MKNNKILFIIVIIILLLLLGYLVLGEWANYRLGSRWIANYKLASTKANEAIFVTSGALQGWKLNLAVKTESENNNKPIYIGIIDSVDGPYYLEKIAISADGEVIAVSCYLSHPEIPNHPNNSVWIHAHDFSKNISIGADVYNIEHDPNAWLKRDVYIQKMLDAHGGIGHTLLRKDITDIQKKLSWLKWRHWSRWIKENRKDRTHFTELSEQPVQGFLRSPKN